MKIVPVPNPNVLETGLPLPMRWNKENVRFDVYDWPEDSVIDYGRPVAWVIPMEFWEGWELWIPNDSGTHGKKIEQFYCWRLPDVGRQVASYLVSSGIIEDF